MRMLKIPNMLYEEYRDIADAILEVIPFSIVNLEFSKKLETGFFYFWDVSYIPPSLLDYAMYPPQTHENVDLLHKKIVAVYEKYKPIKDAMKETGEKKA